MDIPNSDSTHKMWVEENSERCAAELQSPLSRENDAENPVEEPRHAPSAADAGLMNCDLLRWAAAQDDLTPHLQGILVRLTRLMDEYGKLTLPQSQIAPRIRLGQTQTRAAIKALVDCGAFIRVRRGSVGKGRACDLLMIDFARNYDNIGFSSVSGDSTESPTLSALSEKSQNNDSADASVLSRRRNAALSALSAVDNSASACISTGARAQTQPSNTTASDQIRSDPTVVSKEMLDGLAARAGDACDTTATNIHHAAELNRLLRAGCDWALDIEPAVDKLAASFRRRGKTFRTWDLLTEHAIEFRDRRVQGLPPPAPVTVRDPPRNGVRRNLYLEACRA